MSSTTFPASRKNFDKKHFSACGRKTDPPANLRICRVLFCAFYHFGNSAFFPCGKKAPKKHTKAGREKSPRLAIHPSARRKLFLSSIRRRAGCRSARAPNEMFRSGNTGSVSDEMLKPAINERIVVAPIIDRRFHSAQICTSGES